jgi:OmpA family
MRVLLFLLFVVGSLSAQTTSVFFETAQHDLTPEAMASLDALVGSTAKLSDFDLKIEAFTDERGSVDYNQSLAARRADAVANYLAVKNVRPSATETKAWGERNQQFDNETEDTRQLNRRVDIVLNPILFTNWDDYYARQIEQRLQLTNISSDIEQTIYGKEGTKIVIPASSFMYSNGQPVTGQVEMSLIEAYAFQDMIGLGLSTHSDGQQLESGGMVRIEARQNGQLLELKQDASFELSMPAPGGVQLDMDVFYPVTDPSTGAMSWTPTNTGFVKKPKFVDFIFYPDQNLRNDFKQVKLPQLVAGKPVKPQIPSLSSEKVAVSKPTHPRKPREPITDKEAFLKLHHITAKSKKKEIERVEDLYTTQLAAYEKSKASFDKALVVYEKQMIAYDQAVKVAEANAISNTAKMEAYIPLVMDYQRNLTLYFAPLAFDMAMLKYSKITNHSHSITVNALKMIEGKVLEAVIGDLENSLGISYGNTVLSEVSSLSCIRSFTYNRGPRQNDNNYTTQYVFARSFCSNEIGLRFKEVSPRFDSMYIYAFKANPDLSFKTIDSLIPPAFKTQINAFNAAYSEAFKVSPQGIWQKQQQARAAAREQERQYVSNIAQMGWINCDRFYGNNSPKASIAAAESEDVQMFAVFKNIKSCMAMNAANGKGFYASSPVPIGEPITVVAIKMEAGSLYLAMNDTKVGTNVKTLDYRLVSKNELSQALAGLN